MSFSTSTLDSRLNPTEISSKEGLSCTSLEEENNLLSFLLKLHQVFLSTHQEPDFFMEMTRFIRSKLGLKAIGVFKAMASNELQFELLAYNEIDETSRTFPLQVSCRNYSVFTEESTNESSSNVNPSQVKLFYDLRCDIENSCIISIPLKEKHEGFVVLNFAPNEIPPIIDYVKAHLKQLFVWKFEQDKNRDIQLQQRKKEEELRRHSVKNELFLNDILQKSPCGIIQVKNKYIKFVNDRFVKITGFSALELKNQSLTELCADSYDNTENLSKLYNDIEKYGTGKANLILKRKKSSAVVFQIDGIKVTGSIDGKEYLLLCQDATDVEYVEKSLIESEERNKLIMEATIDGVFIINKLGELVYVNQSGCEITGYSKSELTHLNLEVLFPFSQGINDYFKITSSIQKKHRYYGDSELRHKNGQMRCVEVHGTYISLTGEEHYYFSMHDITHRKNAEFKLRESEEKFRSLSENLPDCVLRIEKEGTITYFNSIASNVFGANNISLGLVFHQLICSNKEKVITLFGEVLKHQAIKHIELEHRTTDDKTLTIDWSFSPEIDELGECYSVLAIGRDVTLRKQEENELILAKERAETADRVKSIFLANLSHEIRTPLNAIVGFSNLLDSPEFDHLEKKEFTNLINKNADSLLWMINEIIDYAKLESGHTKAENRKMDLMELFSKIHLHYDTKTKLKFGDSVKFITNIPVDENKPVYVYGDPKRIEKVLTNLLENSLKFINDGFIEVGFSMESDSIKVYVKDSGIGIAVESQSIIFEAFRQEEERPTKVYGGAGLGLAVCKLLVESMGGRLNVISAKDKGAEFYFSLKRVV